MLDLNKVMDHLTQMNEMDKNIRNVCQNVWVKGSGKSWEGGNGRFRIFLNFLPTFFFTSSLNRFDTNENIIESFCSITQQCFLECNQHKKDISKRVLHKEGKQFWVQELRSAGTELPSIACALIVVFCVD